MMAVLILAMLIFPLLVSRCAAAELQSQANPARVPFGDATVGTTISQWIAIENNGAEAYTVTSVTSTGGAFHFSGMSTPHVIHSKMEAGLIIEFSPTTTGTQYGTIRIESTASNRAIEIPLSGTGTPAARTLSLSTSSLTFGKEEIGASETLAVTVRNTGNSRVTISSVTESNSQLGTSGGISGATLAAGESATLNVIYSPTTSGSFSGQISIVSNASNSPSRINVTGSAFAGSTSPTVALKWAESASPNIAGYFVYRSTVSNGTFTKLTSSHITGLSYTDDAVAAGDTYYYEVSAVNTAGVESPRCPEVEVKVP
jgi:hypothetical protein